MFETIFHPSDFTETSQRAFCHALKIALATNAELRMLHINVPGERSNHHDFPSVRDFLARWKVIPKGSSRRAVGSVGIDVRKAIVPDANAVEGVSDFLDENPSSLIVLATHQRAKSTWFGHSKAEPMARNAGISTLFVPDEVRGFVSKESGELNLKSVVIPVSLTPSPRPTVDSMLQLAKILKVENAEFHFLHVGSSSTLPALPHHAPNGVQFHTHILDGEVVPTILNKSKELQADLVAMTTEGHHGFLDALRGSTTERVLRQVECPLWTVVKN